MRRTIMSALAIAIGVACLAPASVACAEPKLKTRDARGNVPRKWDLPKPAAKPHPDVAPSTASGTGDGYNPISFTYFESGDIVVVTGTATGHAGVFDRGYYTGLYSYAVWSANTSPRNGVQREPCIKYRSYDSACALWMPYWDSRALYARNYARAQNGEPYNISSSKSDQSRWYCSKLAWAAWRYTAGVDLDGDGGYWVWPVDLISSRHTYMFGYWN